jgi:hypothetical protein
VNAILSAPVRQPYSSRHPAEHVEDRDEQALLLHDRVPNRIALLLRLWHDVEDALRLTPGPTLPYRGVRGSFKGRAACEVIGQLDIPSTRR